MTPTQKNIIGRIAKLKSEIKELWTDCAILRAENERLRQERDELRRFVYEDAPKIAAKEVADQTAELEARLRETEAELELHKQIYTHTDNDIAIVNAQLRGSYQANKTLKTLAEAAEARAEVAEKEVERLGDIVTEHDGIECTKHDVLVRGAVKEEARLRLELGYIANAHRRSFKNAQEFRTWAQSRARHALNQPKKEANHV